MKIIEKIKKLREELGLSVTDAKRAVVICLTNSTLEEQQEDLAKEIEEYKEIEIENCFWTKGKGNVCVVDKKVSPAIVQVKPGDIIFQNDTERTVLNIEQAQKLLHPPMPGDMFSIIYAGPKLEIGKAFI